MAKVSEWVDPNQKVGGLTKDQEAEIANLVSKSFGSSRIGLLKKAAELGKIKKFMGLPVGFEPDAKAIAEYIQSFPYQGQYQKQDIGAIYSSLSDKYGGGAFKLLGDPPTAEEVYSKIMFFSPESVSRSNITATGLGSYDGSIAETIEWKDVPKMAKGGIINGNPGMAIVGEAGPEAVISNNAQVVPLPTAEEKAFWANHPDPMFNAAQYTLQLERMTDQEKIDAGLMDDPVFQSRIDEVQERAEKERRDKRSQQKWDAIRRARQYEAIANRLGT